MLVQLRTSDVKGFTERGPKLIFVPTNEILLEHVLFSLLESLGQCAWTMSYYRNLSVLDRLIPHHIRLNSAPKRTYPNPAVGGQYQLSKLYVSVHVDDPTDLKKQIDTDPPKKDPPVRVYQTAAIQEGAGSNAPSDPSITELSETEKEKDKVQLEQSLSHPIKVTRLDLEELQRQLKERLHEQVSIIETL